MSVAVLLSGRALAGTSPCLAEAGFAFSVNEGDLVSLDGSASTGGPGIAFRWIQFPGGTPVSLVGADTASPFFTAPEVARGGETLSFLLTASDGESLSTDTVSITVVNRNHPPVADAGRFISVAEGATVTLHGEGSFDVDSDLFSHTWKQLSGPPVTLAGDNGANPTFRAPFMETAGEDGVVATLVFELRVDDGYPLGLSAPGFGFDDVVDTVVVLVTNANNLPTADAGYDQTVLAGSTVALSGADSGDPDGDRLTYSWVQEPGGIPVVLNGADTVSPTFTAPDSKGPNELLFKLTVSDGYGGTDSDTVFVNAMNSSDPPLATAAEPSVSELWPPDHRLVSVGVVGVTNVGNPAKITIDSVFQNEPTSSKGEGDAPIDAFIQMDGTVLLRAERAGNGDGRTYFIHFTASGEGGKSSGVIEVTVPFRNGDRNPEKGRQKGGKEPDDGGVARSPFDSTL